jgi:hypothetical protein
MNVLLVPSLGLDISLIERLARSVDFPIKYKVAINNGKIGALDEFRNRHRDWTVVDIGKNLGCAGSWNLAPEIFPTEPCWLISNDDQEFQPGVLEKICKAADEHCKDHHIIYVNQFDAFDLFVWTAKGVKEIGTFDENFWGVYCEDWEYRCRLKVGNAMQFRMNENLPIKHGKPAAGKHYHELLAGWKPLNEDYLKRKWGTIGDNPIFNCPFFNPHNPINEWKLEEENRRKREVFWNAFWNRPNVSLYE